jgi:hypothetical protein
MATKPNGCIVPALMCSKCPINVGCSWDCLYGNDWSEITKLRMALRGLVDAVEHMLFNLPRKQEYEALDAAKSLLGFETDDKSPLPLPPNEGGGE